MKLTDHYKIFNVEELKEMKGMLQRAYDRYMIDIDENTTKEKKRYIDDLQVKIDAINEVLEK